MLVSTAAVCEKLDAVAVRGQVAGGEHAGAVKVVGVKHGGHEHGRGGAQLEVCNGGAFLCSAGCGGVEEMGPGDSGVATQGDAELGGGLGGEGGHGAHKGGDYLGDGGVGEGYGLGGVKRGGDASDIGSVLQM